jgi:hypothetical protein
MTIAEHSFIDFNEKYEKLSKLPSPYVIKEGGLRFYRNTFKLVPDKIKIMAIDQRLNNNNNRLNFSSISECSKILHISKLNIKKYLLNGEIYKNYKFKFQTFFSFDRKEG